MFSGDYNGVAFSHETVSVSGTVVVPTTSKLTYTLTGGEKLPADAVFVTVIAQDIRYTVDGTAPVAATTGHLQKAAAAGDGQSGFWVIGEGNVAALQMIKDGATGATVALTYFRRS